MRDGVRDDQRHLSAGWRRQPLCREASRPHVEAWQPSGGRPAGEPGQGGRIWVQGGEMLMSSATTAEGHGQIPQGFSGLTSLGPGFL